MATVNFDVQFAETDQNFDAQFGEGSMLLSAEFEPNSGGGGGGAVDSVNGKTGTVVLDAGDLEYDDEETYAAGSVGAELSSLMGDLTNIQSATLITDTASGAIASFPDGAALPVKSLSVAVEPVQDLHGQDAPYPAGGSKNLLPMTLANMKTIQSTSGSWNGNTFTLYGVSYTINVDGGDNVVSVTVNGTATQYSLFRLVNEWTNTAETILSGTAQGSSGSAYRIQAEGDAIKQDLGNGVILPSGYTATRIIIVAPQGTSVSNAVFKPMIRLSSVSDTTFAPYSNICPISGHTSATVTRAGVNLWDEEWEVGSINTDGVNVPASDKIRTKNYIPCLPNTSYYMHGSANFRFYNANKELLSYNTITNNTVTTPANCYYMRFACASSYGTTYNHDISINYPSTDHDYHSGHIAQYTIDLNGTRYGGTLDVTTGVLTVDRASITLNGTEDWVARSAVGSYYTQIADALELDPTTQYLINGIVSSYYPSVSWADSQSSDKVVSCFYYHGIHIKDTTYANVDQLKSALASNPLQVVYPLNTPVVIQLSPTEMQTLLGQNNIWADTGDTTVEYYADTKLYIQKVIS